MKNIHINLQNDGSLREVMGNNYFPLNGYSIVYNDTGSDGRITFKVSRCGINDNFDRKIGIAEALKKEKEFEVENSIKVLPVTNRTLVLIQFIADLSLTNPLESDLVAEYVYQKMVDRYSERLADGLSIDLNDAESIKRSAIALEGMMV
jgi:hypothetical protein